MKSFIIMSFTISTLTFMSGAQAQIIPEESGIPTSYNDCPSGARSACKALFSAYDKCERNHSEDEQALKTCRDSADAVYLSAIGQAPTEAEAGLDKPLPVSTDPSESNYDKMDPDHKGWRNAEE